MRIEFDKEVDFDNQDVVALRLINKNKCVVLLTNYGASILSILVPVKGDGYRDITLGYNTIDELLRNHNTQENYYFGSTVGRYANRIAHGKIRIDGVEYQLSQNEVSNHLHGGFLGLDKIVWDYKIEDDRVIFSHTSPDGIEGYSGNLSVEIAISLNDDNEIRIEYSAQTDKPTVVNLTNHVYFNLNGCEENVLNHSVKINSNSILELDEKNIPTGKFIEVLDTAFDMNNHRVLRDNRIMVEGGFDNCYVLAKNENQLEFAAEIAAENNPVSVQVFTTEPAVQFYTANGFDGSFTGKNNIQYNKFHGLCLEAQNYPDAPNHSNFPNAILRPGETYNQVTIYKINID